MDREVSRPEPIEFTVHGSAIPERKKIIVIGGVNKPRRGLVARERSTEVWLRTVRAEALKHAPPVLLTGPVVLNVCFVLTRIQSLPKKVAGRLPHTKRPDRDNLLKVVTDALTGIIWGDDAQVYAGSTEKWYAALGDGPCVEIAVLENKEETLK